MGLKTIVGDSLTDMANDFNNKAQEIINSDSEETYSIIIYDGSKIPYTTLYDIREGETWGEYLNRHSDSLYKIDNEFYGMNYVIECDNKNYGIYGALKGDYVQSDDVIDIHAAGFDSESYYYSAFIYT